MQLKSNDTNSIINKEYLDKIRKISINTFNAILFVGQPSMGKLTLARELIKIQFNLKTLDIRLKSTTIKINNNQVEINYLESLYHFEINISEYGLYSRNIICSFIHGLFENEDIILKKKILILTKFNNVPKDAQKSLKNIIEKFGEKSCIILTAYTSSGIDAGLYSHLIKFFVKYPNKETVKQYITNKRNDLSKKRVDIITNSFTNLFNLNLLIDYDNYKITNPLDIYIEEIYNILKKKNILNLNKIRHIIYKLHLLNFNNKEIIKRFIYNCGKLNIFTNEDYYIIYKSAALNEHLTKKCNKTFYCLERFFITIKSIIDEKFISCSKYR